MGDIRPLKQYICIILDSKVGKVLRYQRGNQKLQIKKGQKNTKGQKDNQRSTKHYISTHHNK